MKKPILPTIVLGLMNPAISFADINLDLLNTRITELEKAYTRIAELEKTQLHLAELTNTGNAESKPNAWNDRVTISGLVEVEAFKAHDGSDNTSDITLATVELGIDVQINKQIGAHVLLLHEEGEDQEVVVDEGYISMAFGESGWNAIVGKQYVPFGNLESNFIIDPLTLDLAETQDTALTFVYENSGSYAAVYAMNGDINEVGKDENIEQFGLSIGHRIKNSPIGLDIGIDYSSNIAEAESLSDTFSTSEVEGYVGGLAAHAVFEMGNLSVFTEYVTALEKFDAADLASSGDGAKPNAYNLEIAYAFDDVSVALGIQETDEAEAAGLDEQRLILGISTGIADNTSFGIELMRASTYEENGGDDITVLTMQLAVAI